MADKQKCPKCVKGAPGWMVTFGDLMSLLLTFFVMLLSFSTMDVVKYKQMAGSVKEAFGMVKDTNMENIPKAESMIKKQFSSPSMQTKHVITLLRQALREMKMENKGQILQDKDGVRLRVEGSVFFPSGKAEIKKEGLTVLDKIGTIIASLPYKVRVEGHTDNMSLSKNNLFPSNWELSGARAGAVIRYFISKDDLTADRFMAVGFADTVPILPNDTTEHRAKNRRVEFLFSTVEKNNDNGLTFDKESFSLKDDIKNMFGNAKETTKSNKIEKPKQTQPKAIKTKTETEKNK